MGAIESTKPGVVAIVNAGQVARPIERQPSSTAFVVGLASWGPVGVPTVITSLAEFVRVFGVANTLGYLYAFAYIYFNNFAGRQALFVRAAKNAAKATVTINNRVGGSPAATFKFDAKYPSSSVDISVIIADTSGSTDLVDVTVKSSLLGITETYAGVDLRIAGTLTTINNKSKLVSISLAVAAVTGATGRPAAGTVTLTGGTDGSSSITAAEFAPFIDKFNDQNLGTGQILVPGHSSAEVIAALVAHAGAYNRLALIEPVLATTPTDAVTALTASPSSFAAAYYPWVEMLAIDGSGVRKFYPPSIFAAGACAQVDRTIGTHKAPANIAVPGAVDVERNADGSSVITDNVREVLNAKNVNVIAPLAGEGIKIYGARVMAPTGETRVAFVHQRRMLNMLFYSLKLGYAWAVFAVVDGRGRLFRDLVATGKSLLRPLWQAGALYGATEEEAFVVVADSSNNPADELDNGRVHVQVGVKLSPTAEQIFINIDNVPLSQDLSVLQ